jgi:hypothetical protein
MAGLPSAASSSKYDCIACLSGARQCPSKYPETALITFWVLEYVQITSNLEVGKSAPKLESIRHGLSVTSSLAGLWINYAARVDFVVL